MTTQESPINSDAFAYVVGMDFGTTFSGAGYIFIKNADRKEVIDIKKWQVPKNQMFQYTKVPTIIRYHKKNPNLYKCGSEALSLMPPKAKEYGDIIRLFKLHLDEESEGIPELPEGLTLLKVISDYLKDFHKSICAEMQAALGGPADFEKKKASIRYCLTVPAMWSNQAKTTMREASIQAGIINKDHHPDRLILIGEPESAALYAEKMKGGITIKSEETLMICDAGGGTIDLTTFKKMIEGETKTFKEITEGYGSSYGSAQLDLYFRNYIQRTMKNSRVQPTDKAMEELVDHFQKQVKRCFGDEISVADAEESDNAVFRLPYDLNGVKLIKDGFNMDGENLEIENRVLKEVVFDPVIEEILLMIEYQMSQLDGTYLNYIILVGGFGQSKYLLRRIKDKFEDKVGSIIVPDAGELAVARGAVYFGLDPYSISHRRMRLSYGVSISSPFIEGVDREDYKVRDKSGQYFCKNRFDVFVRKGQDVSLSDCVTREYFTYNSKTCHIQIYGFQGDVPPRYVSVDKDDKKNQNNDKEAYRVADFIMELPSLQLKGEGEKTTFNLDMYFGHMEIKIEVDIPGQGEKLVFKASYEKDANKNVRRSKALPSKYKDAIDVVRSNSVRR